MKEYQLKPTPEPTKPDWCYKDPTEKQLQALKRFGVDIPENLNRGEASALLYHSFKDRPSVFGSNYVEVAMDILKEGSPYDDPTPEVTFEGKHFAFTGTFESATRAECNEITKKLSGSSSKSITLATDYLVIGNKGSANWATSAHGRKIEKAAVGRMKLGKPAIICESDWINAVQLANEKSC